MKRGHVGLVVVALTIIATTACTGADEQSLPAAGVRLNQLGFQPVSAKRAVVRSDELEPSAWRLLDAEGVERANGVTFVFGENTASGEHVHTVDFSAFETTGVAYRLVVDGVESRPFAISNNIYGALKQGAFAYFYHNRASTPIDADLVGEVWARQAGHAPDVATCFDQVDEGGRAWSGCGYALDVSKGWYDAGDQGKYVVNGGISVWTLLNLHERDAGAFADGAAAIPEAGNGVADLLDEARWELEFLLAMQVPEGASVEVADRNREDLDGPLNYRFIDAEGMAHHKMSDAHWTPLPTAPHEDTETRYLYPPSTAATLNLAAVAAQGARIWREIDPVFSGRCLSAAETAYAAALRHPDVLAVGRFTGSGAYSDGDVTDEFYWAAAELYITTGEATYAEALRASPHFLTAPVGDDAGMGDIAWPNVATLGTISLVAADNGLTDAELDQAKSGLVTAAEGYLGQAERQGYVIPYAVSAYPWGSNSSLLNRAMVLAWAHEFTGERAYRDAVVDVMDYILGRNPLDVSYVSGFGANAMENPHHRFWAHSLDADYPPPPPGALSGGPNSSNMSDPVAQTMRGDCLAQTCWRDDAQAFTMNEVAINWNAPLVWVASYLDGADAAQSSDYEGEIR